MLKVPLLAFCAVLAAQTPAEQFLADYERSPDGLLSPTQETAYTDQSRVLYRQGGYNNWHMAQVLDFRVAYSIAKRAYNTGVVDARAKALVHGMSARVLTPSLMIDLMRPEVYATQPDKGQDEALNFIMSRAGERDWPPLLKSGLLEKKDLTGLVWRLMLHTMIVQLPVPAFLDSLSTGAGWIKLSDADRVSFVLARIKPGDYHSMGRDRVEERDLQRLFEMLRHDTDPYNQLRNQ